MQIIAGRFSRRAMLVGAIASIPAIAGAVAAPAIATTVDTHPDAELIRLDAEMGEAHARKEASLKVESETYFKCAELHPPQPGKWQDPEMPADITAYIIAHPFNKPKDDPEEVRAYFKACEDSKAAHDASREAWLEEVEAINRKGGLKEAELAYEACLDKAWEIGRLIFATPANTLHGMMIKLRTADRLELPVDAENNEALASIAADIRRLAVGGAS
ncbi:hypothetical protein EOD29_22950 [Mesorhizobium sp. M1A.T.Ca.IN.004.03.1.1]|nr:hypothetical protein EOD29_22950 [Mesorhizobium sp. M1A.T.Ca.IN.004.03.1.1]